jgi:DNA repair protein RadA/Sms
LAKPKIRFACAECGYISPVQLGRCPECQAWGSLREVEERPANASTSRARKAGKPLVLSLDQVPIKETERISTGMGELDRVLGGGMLPGAVILLSGEPGVGKSTLLLQAAAGTARNGKKLLYVTGEESAAQVRLRAERLGLPLEDLFVLAETEVPAILEIASGPYNVLVVDSVQTLRVPELGSPAGTPTQLKESAQLLAGFAKEKGIPLWLVGHITKEGSIAGPKILEHLVDTVLYLEGEKERTIRVLRSFKNRFGAVNELGVFEMTGEGLGEVKNPSALFIAERAHGASGSVVTPVLEGRRPLLMEIQALVSPSFIPMPRRQSLGADPSRVGLLAAVLEKKVGLRLFDQDLFVNVAGGTRITEPAADLAIVAAISSSYEDRQLPEDLVVLGEVGLAGEIRRVGRMPDRLKEAQRMGFERVLGPAAELDLIDMPKLKKIKVERVVEIFSAGIGLSPVRPPKKS